MPTFQRHSFGSDQVMAGMRRREEEQNKREQQIVTAYMTAAKTGTLDKFPKQMLSMIQQNYPNQYQVGQAVQMQYAKQEKESQRVQEDRKLDNLWKSRTLMLTNEESNAPAIKKIDSMIYPILSERTGVDLSPTASYAAAEKKKAEEAMYSVKLKNMLDTLGDENLDQYRGNTEEIRKDMLTRLKLDKGYVAALLAPMDEKLVRATTDRKTKKDTEAAAVKLKEGRAYQRGEFDRQQTAKASLPDIMTANQKRQQRKDVRISEEKIIENPDNPAIRPHIKFVNEQLAPGSTYAYVWTKTTSGWRGKKGVGKRVDLPAKPTAKGGKPVQMTMADVRKTAKDENITIEEVLRRLGLEL